MKVYRMVRTFKMREVYEIQAADDQAARAIVDGLNTKIEKGEEYDPEEVGEFVDTYDVEDDSLFELTGYRG